MVCLLKEESKVLSVTLLIWGNESCFSNFIQWGSVSHSKYCWMLYKYCCHFITASMPKIWAWLVVLPYWGESGSDTTLSVSSSTSTFCCLSAKVSSSSSVGLSRPTRVQSLGTLKRTKDGKQLSSAPVNLGKRSSHWLRADCPFDLTAAWWKIPVALLVGWMVCKHSKRLKTMQEKVLWWKLSGGQVSLASCLT